MATRGPPCLIARALNRTISMSYSLRAAGVALALTAAPASFAATAELDLASPVQADELVSAILSENHGLAAAEQALEAARRRILPAGALPDPRINAHLAPNTLDGFTGPGGVDRNASGIISLSQDLPWPGTLALRAMVAEQKTVVAAQTRSALKLRLAALARIGYARWAYVHEALEINRQNAALVEELRRVAESRYAAGLAEQQDVLQAEVRLAQLRRERLALDRLRSDILSETNALLGKPATAPLDAPGVLPAPTALPAPQALQSRAVDRPPRLKQLDARLAAAQAGVSLAEKAYYPDLRFSVGYNGLRPAPEARLTVGASINLPFGQAKRDETLGAAQATVGQLGAQKTDQQYLLISQVQQAYDAGVEALESIAVFETDLIPRSRESLGAARSLYGSGGGDFADIVLAEQALLGARLDLARTRADYFIAIAQLQRWTASPLPVSNNSSRVSQ